jgi:hypothetical protein
MQLSRAHYIAADEVILPWSESSAAARRCDDISVNVTVPHQELTTQNRTQNSSQKST